MLRVFLLPLLVVLLLCAQGRQDVQAQRSEKHTVIVVADREHGPVVARLFEAALLARLEGVKVVYLSPRRGAEVQNSSLKNAALVFSLDTRKGDRWVLLLQKGDDTWRRQVRGETEDAAAAEAAALIAAQAAAALLSRQQEEVLSLSNWRAESTAAQVGAPNPSSRSPTKSKPTKDSRPASETSEAKAHKISGSVTPVLSLSFSGGYRGEALGSHHLWTSGLFVESQLGAREGLRGFLSFAFFSPVKIESSLGSFTVSRYPIDGGALWVFRWPHFTLSPGAGLVLEPLYRGKPTANAGVGTSPGKWAWGWGASARLGSSWQWHDRWGIVFNLSLTCLIQSERFVSSDANSSLYSPYQWRPRAELGLRFRLF